MQVRQGENPTHRLLPDHHLVQCLHLAILYGGVDRCCTDRGRHRWHRRALTLTPLLKLTTSRMPGTAVLLPAHPQSDPSYLYRNVCLRTASDYKRRLRRDGLWLAVTTRACWGPPQCQWIWMGRATKNDPTLNRQLIRGVATQVLRRRLHLLMFQQL
jgi:hypothetical protein